MELDFLEDEPKLILTYPHKSKFSMIYGLSMLFLGVIVLLILKHLSSYGIDFSKGNGFDQKTSEYIIERYMNSTFFMNADESVTDDWHKIAYEHIAAYQSDVEIPDNIVPLE